MVRDGIDAEEGSTWLYHGANHYTHLASMIAIAAVPIFRADLVADGRESSIVRCGRSAFDSKRGVVRRTRDNEGDLARWTRSRVTRPAPVNMLIQSISSYSQRAGMTAAGSFARTELATGVRGGSVRTRRS